MGLPTFNTNDDASPTDKARQAGRVLIPWLKTPPNCPACGQLMLADTVHDPTQAAYVHAWRCPDTDDCGTRTYREPEHHDQPPAHPTPGAPRIREALP